jgi:hypothetical protein
MLRLDPRGLLRAVMEASAMVLNCALDRSRVTADPYDLDR